MRNRSSYLNSFNLFSNGAKSLSNLALLAKQKQKQRKIIELHFINPNILFLQAQKWQKQSRAQTAFNSGPKQTEQKRRNIKSSPQAGRFGNKKRQLEKEKKEQKRRNQNKEIIRKRLDEYIKMEHVYNNFMATGRLKTIKN